MTDKYDGAKFIHLKDSINCDAHNPHYGGATLCYLYVDGDTYVAVAHCHPKDRYDKKLGRTKAFGLLNQLVGDPVKHDGSSTEYHDLKQAIMEGELSAQELISFMSEEFYVPR